MKILSVTSLALPEVKVIRYQRFTDVRGYFTESFNQSEFNSNPDLSFLKNAMFIQVNESYSKQNTIRGLHFQWSPYQGKLVRTVFGHMTDLVMDIRKGSPNFGKIIAYDLPSDHSRDYGELIWIPVGFAHGGYYPEETQIEYLCTSNWNPSNEAGISPITTDIDWSLCDSDLKKKFEEIANGTHLMSDKDRDGFTLKQWLENPNSNEFIYDAVSS